jgi:hypothetical protein
VTRAQLDRLYAALEGHDNKRLANAVKLLVWTGARSDEVLGALGIRRTLSRNPQYADLKNRPHRDAAVKAFQSMVTCRTTGGGTGLTEVQMAAQELGGSVRLTTGDGFVEYFPHRARYGNTGFNLTGVQVEVVVPT